MNRRYRVEAHLDSFPHPDGMSRYVEAGNIIAGVAAAKRLIEDELVAAGKWQPTSASEAGTGTLPRFASQQSGRHEMSLPRITFAKDCDTDTIGGVIRLGLVGWTVIVNDRFTGEVHDALDDDLILVINGEDAYIPMTSISTIEVQ